MTPAVADRLGVKPRQSGPTGWRPFIQPWSLWARPGDDGMRGELVTAV
ncbi:uncharacterized protein PODANS_1_11840 [Podospora anserina S mat+]|uniref:Podospora anserina S mat+ genomic DNA chromosome 1, supercontig 2 n=1 Tax=Podospora anserina (strain S / ATCC MYA-4624 / DSM 980 / FGSC 10383) TaxID=515849 RepID=B2AYQ0_PODAN|nr:uncharacterized protein PODANS_1_11840 [Podospora anserina S mat+]CAP69524.1 unnamed protein product [Podospora anserina S mat+]CDP23541.1 Putative protein of unknown function [Podospora anserina S mat+]